MCVVNLCSSLKRWNINNTAQAKFAVWQSQSLNYVNTEHIDFWTLQSSHIACIYPNGETNQWLNIEIRIGQMWIIRQISKEQVWFAWFFSPVFLSLSLCYRVFTLFIIHSTYPTDYEEFCWYYFRIVRFWYKYSGFTHFIFNIRQHLKQFLHTDWLRLNKLSFVSLFSPHYCFNSSIESYSRLPTAFQ